MRDVSEIEEWRPIEGYPDYAVSNLGRVKRLTSRTCAKAGAILKMPARSKRAPYPCVSLCRDGVCPLFSVHQIVAEAFLGPPPEGFEVNHKDGDKSNPRADNLEYTTSSGNKLHSYVHGLQDATGERNGQSKLTEADVITIRAVYTAEWGQQRRLAEEFDVSPTTIRAALFGRCWSHVAVHRPIPRPVR